MSNRNASPQPVARWPFILGACLLVAIAAYALLTSEGAPPLGVVFVAFVCALLSAALCITPYLYDGEARLRLAEAAARNNADFQARRLAQVAEQLANAVSRSQSTEEQAGQALGTVEEITERLVAQSDEVTQALARNNEREQAALKAELETLHRERAEILGSLASRIQALEAGLADILAGTKKAGAATSRSLSLVAAQLEEINARLLDPKAAPPAAESEEDAPPDSMAPPAFAEISDAAPAQDAAEKAPDDIPVAEDAALSPSPSAPASASLGEVIVDREEMVEIDSWAVDDAETEGDEADLDEPAVEPDEPASAPEPPPRPKPPARSRAKQAPAHVVKAPPLEPLELALEGMPEPRHPARFPKRASPGVTSLVATAYIGIGNKLFLRGEGPGLSWEQGVAMQFLAIGKWGWTTTEASTPVVCRIYRNDDTPMLDENLVIDPGHRAEVTPRF